ncbi:sigma-54 interaction domain-containing protein [Nitrospira sp. M1]
MKLSKTPKDDFPEVVRRLKEILTGHASPADRIHEALKFLGRFSHHTLSRQTVADDFSLKKQQAELHAQSTSNQQQRTDVSGPFNLIGNSLVMQNIYEAIRRAGNSQATVLIRGESGTGKELVAKAIHTSSLRKSGPFIPLHCAAVPDSLIESTMFGYERGAFTGANMTRRGKLEQASGGTLFLDEVGDIPLSTQVKLLRVLQEREYERVGGTHLLAADIRIIAATHRDLEAMVLSGTFREDLYYRLNVVPMILAPLRERQEDIIPLAEHFLRRFNHDNQRDVKLDTEMVSMLSRYHWPGNIRELQNCIERIVVLADSQTVTITAIPKSLQPYMHHIRDVTLSPQKNKPSKSLRTLPKDVRNLERERLVNVLQDVGWIKAKAARKLGLTPRQVAYKMKKYNIHRSSLLSQTRD